MQTQQQPTKKTNGGRRPGSLSKNTIRKRAVKLLEMAVIDDGLSAEIRTLAALRLTEITHG